MDEQTLAVEDMSDMKRAELLGRIDELDKLKKEIDYPDVIEKIEKQKEMLRAELNS